ncbi:type II toxin-antitoxin system YafQ family toxin [Candidatus Palauibacter sp.]|uniref:type II toxin-antitoxin system YafQ family toxin n=1 Tax=Candidatus Palauibacter sp. TaxID=3101350 RepID=UPI003C6EE0B5
MTPVRSSQFKRDVRRAKARGRDTSKLRALLELLIQRRPVPARYRDHPLRGPWRGCREAHLESDWLVICRVKGDELHLVRTGTHSDLFKE